MDPSGERMDQNLKLIEIIFLARDEKILQKLGLHVLVDHYWIEGIKILRDVARQYKASA